MSQEKAFKGKTREEVVAQFDAWANDQYNWGNWDFKIVDLHFTPTDIYRDFELIVNFEGEEYVETEDEEGVEPGGSTPVGEGDAIARALLITFVLFGIIALAWMFLFGLPKP